MNQTQSIQPNLTRRRVTKTAVKRLIRSSGVSYLGGYAIPATVFKKAKKEIRTQRAIHSKVTKARKGKVDIYAAISLVAVSNKPLNFDQFALELACKVKTLPGDIYALYKDIYLTQVH